MTFSEQIVYGMFRPGKYKELLDLKKGRSVAYVIVMMLVLGIVGFLIPVSATVAGFGGFTELFEKKMAPITYEEGTMSIERPFSLNLGTVKVVINTEKDHVTEERVKAPGAYVAFGAKYVNLYISAGGKVDDFGGYKLTDIFPPRLDNQTLVRAVPYIYVYLAVGFLFSCVGYFIKYAIVALIFSIAVNGINKQLALGLTFGQVFMLCFYGQTAAMILSNFNTALGLLPSMIVSVVGIFISVHMMTTSLVMMRHDREV